LDEAGNGDAQLVHHAGAIGPVRELLQYTPTWHHGHYMMRFIPPRAADASQKVSENTAVSNSRIKDSSPNILRLQHSSSIGYSLKCARTPLLCRRIIEDFDSSRTSTNSNLTSARRRGLSMWWSKDVSEYVPALREVGAHPLGPHVT
jgi:hypothetical protein